MSAFEKLIIIQIYFKLIHMFQWYILNFTIQKNLIFSTPNQITTSKREKLSIGYTCCDSC
jgi:hypothetical protein